MPSPDHQAYRAGVRAWCRAHRHEPDVAAQLTRFGTALVVLWELDLAPARPVLQACYAPLPRGGDPWDPLVMLRCLLLAALVKQPAINDWVDDLRANRVLRVLAGLLGEDVPGVGTFYDFFHRLHNGPIRRSCEHQLRPSDAERQRARTPRQLKKAERPPKEKKKPGRRRKGDPAPVVDPAVTERLVAELQAARDQSNPADLQARLAAILLTVGVHESAQRGLLGKLGQLRVTGDGSALVTGASSQGRRVCGHPRTQHCDCPKRYSDPDAQFGWDHYRQIYFFGHHFYEIQVNSEGNDLPLAIRLDPGNASDFTASLLTFERLRKDLRVTLPELAIKIFIADSGHDSEPTYRFLLGHGVTPVMPLKSPAPATHPKRPDVHLSPRGVPTCQAGAEMTSWGSAGPERKIFVCPVKAGKLPTCPLAPPEQPDWRCQPGTRLGPAVVIKVDDNPRLCPPIPRNSPGYQPLMNLRSGCERSNSVKKETFKLEAAHHRRSSFWLIRLHLIALLQHARAWVARASPADLVADLLGHPQAQVA